MNKPANISIEEIRKMLFRAGIQPSYHRLKILQYLFQTDKHPTVDVIYRDLQKLIPTLSKTTIYNTLRLLMREELVLGVYIDENEYRFDANSKPHVHFKCEQCGEVTDVMLAQPELELSLVEGHKVVSMEVNLRGVCANCLKKNT